MRAITHLVATTIAFMALAPSARAHICMEAPISRVGTSCTSASAQKPGPCGINTRSTKYVTEFKPGQTITVTLNETVNHDSHYRIAFNPNGATFEDPTGIDDKDGKHPFVLLDNITDESAARQSVQVTLPNITCDNCTLQLIQVMYDKTGNGFGNDDIYYSCADIVLKGTPSNAPDAGSADAGASTDAGATTADAAARPAPDAGSGGGGGNDSGVAADAGASADGGHGPATSDAGHDAATADGGGAAPDGEDKDDGGCSVAWGRPGESLGFSGLTTLALALVAYRRRRRG